MRPIDLPPMFVPPVMLVRQARGQGRQERGPRAAARAGLCRCPDSNRPRRLLLRFGLDPECEEEFEQFRLFGLRQSRERVALTARLAPMRQDRLRNQRRPPMM